MKVTLINQVYNNKKFYFNESKSDANLDNLFVRNVKHRLHLFSLVVKHRPNDLCKVLHPGNLTMSGKILMPCLINRAFIIRLGGLWNFVCPADYRFFTFQSARVTNQDKKKASKKGKDYRFKNESA